MTSSTVSRLGPDDLMSLEEYARVRKDFRAKVMAHKKGRQVQIGPNVTLYFEDRLTIQYQVQEMLRIERIFEPEGIAQELAAYSALIPDGTNWKATLMVEYPDENERRAALARLIGIERKAWIQVEGHAKVSPIANEDLERETAEKTSSVHFLRFELTPGMIAAVKSGAAIAMGIDHEAYAHAVDAVRGEVRDSLAQDLSG